MRLMRVVWLVAILAGVVVAAPKVQAQMGGREQVRQALEETERMIERAADLALEARNRQAGEYVKQALEVQKLARMAFQNGRFDAAMTRTRAARSLVEKAMAHLVRPEEHAERVEHELQQTDEFLQMAHERIPPDAPQQAKARLAGAMKKQGRAWELFHDGRLRPALRMTHSVRQTLRRMQEMFPRFDPERFRDGFESVEELVNEARERAEEGDPRAERQIERAQDALAECKARAERGDFRGAERALEQARRLAEEVLMHGDPRDAYRRALEQYEAHAERLKDQLAETPNEEAMRLYQESLEHFRMSQRAAEGDKDAMWRAGAEMRIAMRLLQQAGRLLD